MSAPASLRDRYARDGYLCPLPALSPSEAKEALGRFEALLAGRSSLGPDERFNPHLLLPWVARLVADARILAAVEAVLGRDILVWRASFFSKPAGSPDFVAWHQDSVYWGLDGRDVTTAWLALTDSAEANGCVRVLPGSHRVPELPHVLDDARSNLLIRGQRIAAPIPETEVRPLELRAGQFSLHHVGLAHGSGPNRSQWPRVGLAIRYIAPSVKPQRGRHGASLVRGRDSHGHYRIEPLAARDGDPAARRVHAASLRRHAREMILEALRQRGAGALFVPIRLALRPGTWRALWRAVFG